MNAWDHEMRAADETATRNGAAHLPPPDAAAEVARLAGIPRLQYERLRVETAKMLGVRTSALDAEVDKARPPAPASEAAAVEVLDPWHEPVEGLALAEEIRARLRAHVVFANATDPDALTLWTFGSYLMDTWRLFPKVLIGSPTKRCGKSTLLEALESVCYRAIMCANLTGPTLFRSIDKWAPTLLIDEADRFLRDADDINGIINAGHTRRAAFVNRCVEANGEQDVKRFSVWCPQVFAGIGTQADTLVDRSLNIGLRRKLPTETVERLPFDLHERMLRTRRQLARWAADNAGRVLAADDEPPPPCGNDRMRDNFGPLWRLAAVLGGEWPRRIAAAYAIQAATGDADDEPAAIMLLRDMLGIFEAKGAARLPTAALLAELILLEDRPWADWRHGRPLAPQSIAKLLRPFDVRPRTSKLPGHPTAKAYFRDEIEAAVARYADNGASYPLPRYRFENKEEIGTSIRNQYAAGYGYEPEITPQYQRGNGVTDKTPHPGGSGGIHPDTDRSDTLDPEAWR